MPFWALPWSVAVIELLEFLHQVPMGKITVLVIAVVLIWFVVRGLRRTGARTEQPSRPVEVMVPCAHCRLNLPQSEAVAAEGIFFCCEEHRRLGAR